MGDGDRSVRGRWFLLGLLVLVLTAATGWKTGTVAADTPHALAAVDPVTVDLPPVVADAVTSPTLVFYFSPICPHCKDAMPEINSLVGKVDGYKVLGVASGSGTEAELQAFRDTYKPAFPIVVDADRRFASVVAARSTPSVYLVTPATTAFAGVRIFDVVEAYAPFGRGMGAVIRMRRHPEEPFRDFQGYQGPAVCGACHGQESDAWSTHPHSRAFYTLYMRQKHDDPACVSCHVTALGQAGGFVAGDLSSPMSGVTCEACHGPSGPHDGTPTDAKAACVQCHDAEHSIAFDIEKGLPLIDHFATVGLSEEELRQRLTAVQTGTFSRSLLAFPEGPTTGVAACTACHASEHKSWAKSSHAAAMNVLPEASAADPACVRCHAAPTHMGISGTTPGLADYRTSEGVGCESCHGAGTEHISQPRADNIVGLGTSCPECVIEAVCTTCHDQANDPQWNLQARLKAAHH